MKQISTQVVISNKAAKSNNVEHSKAPDHFILRIINEEEEESMVANLRVGFHEKATKEVI